MILIDFILPSFLGFFLIYKAIISIDKIDRVKKHGIKRRAKVIKIREETNKDFNDEETSGYIINHTEVNNYFTVNLKTKMGVKL